jgi:hypothetical protein
MLADGGRKYSKSLTFSYCFSYSIHRALELIFDLRKCLKKSMHKRALRSTQVYSSKISHVGCIFNLNDRILYMEKAEY